MEPKTYLNRYRIVSGPSGLPIRVTGGAGERTYKAEDVTTGEQVALELVPAAGLDPEVLGQLEAEAVAAKQLNHINIPKLYDFGFEHDHLVYASELFDGTTAEAWVTAHGPLAVGAALRIAQQVVGALGAATFHGILHHAINPRNVMIVPGQTTDGEWPLIKVLNFVGIAPEVSTTDAGSLGAAHFASPEQLQGGNVDFRSEIYSLGKTLAFLLTGSALGAGAQKLDHASGIPASVKELIAQMIATDPADRPLDPLAFQRHIQDLLAQVDRRDQVATKFGLGPAKSVAENRTPWAFPMKPLAWAALLLAAATIAGLVIAAGLRSGRGIAANEKPIGVPVGVPEAPTAPAVAAPAAPVPDSGTSTAGTVAANPPVLTSDPEPPAATNDAAAATESEAPANAQPSTQVASNNIPATTDRAESAPPAPAESRDTTEASRTALATNNQSAPAEEPMPPAAGPNETQPQPSPARLSETANSYAQERTSTRDQTTQRARSSSSETSKAERQKIDASTVATGSTPQPKKSSSVAATSKRAKKDVQLADANDAMPPVPRGAVRAEYLGTTPDGNLVFGLPSSERGYVAPAEPRRRRARPIVSELPPDVEVLPALPPEDEGEEE